MSKLWITVCSESDLVIGSGVCALLETCQVAQQIALFRESSSGPVYAISNYDPLGGAYVLSRGIIGSLGDKLVVASPLYKQHYNLETGECLEDTRVKIPAWNTRIQDGKVQLEL